MLLKQKEHLEGALFVLIISLYLEILWSQYYFNSKRTTKQSLS